MSQPYDYSFLLWWYNNTNHLIAPEKIVEYKEKYEKETKSRVPYDIYTLGEFEEDNRPFPDRLLRIFKDKEDMDGDLEEHLYCSWMNFWYGNDMTEKMYNTNNSYHPKILATCWAKWLRVPKEYLGCGTTCIEQIYEEYEDTWIGAISASKSYEIIQIEEGLWSYKDMVIIPFINNSIDFVKDLIVAGEAYPDLLGHWKDSKMFPLSPDGIMEGLIDKKYVFGSFFFETKEKAQLAQDMRLGLV